MKYKVSNIDALKQTLKDEGFLDVYEWTDRPATQYTFHLHSHDTALVVISGRIYCRSTSNLLAFMQR